MKRTSCAWEAGHIGVLGAEHQHLPGSFARPGLQVLGSRGILKRYTSSLEHLQDEKGAKSTHEPREKCLLCLTVCH
jgi:hypothetical protein